MNINHDTQNRRLTYEEQGQIAYLRYEIIGDKVDVITTYVPASLEGRGVASKLMQALCDYAIDRGLKPTATCSYAKVWLSRYMVEG